MVDGAADEGIDVLVSGQHVLEGVRLALDPERVVPADVGADRVGRRLAGADDDLVVVRVGDGARAVPETSGEEVVPRREAPVRVLGVVAVLVHPDRPLRTLGLPPGLGGVQYVQRLRTAEELAPHREDLPQHRVEARIPIGGEARGRPHRPVQHRAERCRRHLVSELGRHREHLVDHRQQLVDTVERARFVAPPDGNLGDHPFDVHAQHRLRVQQRRDLLHDGGKRRRGLPFGDASPVTREPRLEVFLGGQPAGRALGIGPGTRGGHGRTLCGGPDRCLAGGTAFARRIPVRCAVASSTPAVPRRDADRVRPPPASWARTGCRLRAEAEASRAPPHADDRPGDGAPRAVP